MAFVDRSFLERCLADGLSLEAIGRHVSRDPSTVSYWLRRYGLRAVHYDRVAARGALPRPTLEARVAEGFSIEDIAADLHATPTSVRYWLRRYGLVTAGMKRRNAARAAREQAANIVRLTCPHHGVTDFLLEKRGYHRCLRCRSDAVARRRRKVKDILVAEAGGRCIRCGYDRYVGALHFHHRDASTKRFSLSHTGVTRSLEKAREEARKCDLLCSNCHAEIEAGLDRLS